MLALCHSLAWPEIPQLWLHAIASVNVLVFFQTACVMVKSKRNFEFIQSIKKYLSTYYMVGTVLGTGNKALS